MRDPYLYDDVDVLRNLGNIRNAEELRQAECDVTRHTMALVYAHHFNKFNTNTLCEIHRIIFDSLYEWAGEFRTISLIKHEDVLVGDTVHYAHPKQIKKELDDVSKEISKLKKSESKKDLVFKLVRIAAKIWQTHPFREGNTRTVVSFIALLAKHLNIELDYTLFETYAPYVRNALVWASQGIYSKPEYLERIFMDAAGVDVVADSVKTGSLQDYTHIEGYNVADYKEQPHKYVDE
ncbi:MAG: Fic family protein [Oscillospiraceae bacterium]|nr:Fic family protein [Oscillospiraceae bacterium]